MTLLLAAIAVLFAGGVAALATSRWPRIATWIGAGSAVAACIVGLTPTARILIQGHAESLQFGWDGTHGSFVVEADPLSAFFLAPVLGLAALAAVYGADYLLAYAKHKPMGPPWLFFNLFVGGMVLVLIARTTLLFLVAWELMSIAAFCLVTFEHETTSVRRAGWTYLVATHLGVVCLFIAFLLLGRRAGSMEFAAFQRLSSDSGVGSGAVFILILIGFGAKAGFVPLHVWLPEAHPAAPSHVSALMSGVMIKMGIYGIFRVLTFLGHAAPWWGWTLAAIGLVTAVAGIALSIHQRDVKRALAYSSIENIGLIALAIGISLWGAASGRTTVAVLGITAALFHIWNHALMKGLMFLSAGSVLHGAGAKDMEKLGGLLRRMPWTGTIMIGGAVAIAALPPLNGFASKWLLYMTLLECGQSPDHGQSLIALLTIGMITIVGGLSAVGFVRLIGIVLLGSPRSDSAHSAHESSPWMLGPMLILLSLCGLSAIFPGAAIDLFSNVVIQLSRFGDASTFADLEAHAPIRVIGNVNIGLLTVALFTGGFLYLLIRRNTHIRMPTWGCGYARPTVRIQYTGRSFAEMLAENVLPRFLRPRSQTSTLRGPFPKTGSFTAESPDPFYESAYRPFFRRWADRFVRLRILQQGKIHFYLIYIMVTVVAALTWAALRTRLMGAT